MSESETSQLLRALGLRIRELRTAQGYSQEGFADRCGVHRTFMGTVERGESNLSFLNISKVAIALEVPLSTLFHDLETKAQDLHAGPSASKTGRERRPSGAKTK